MALDPYAAALLEALAASGRPGFDELSPTGARLWLKELTDDLQGADGIRLPIHRQEREVPSLTGVIRLRFYKPESARANEVPAPAVLFFHGGGWVIGDLDTHDQVCAALAHQSGCQVVAVDYRLAPEHPFPAAIEDAVTAFDWLVTHALTLGLDPARIAVAGDSAGATIAAAMAQVCRDTSRRMPCLQVLMYPATDLRGGSASRVRYGEGFLLTEKQLVWCADHYLRNEADKLDPRASPLLAVSLRGLPRALVIVAGCDPLRDEGLAYAERLRMDEVEVDLSYCPGMIHGFLLMTEALPMAKRMFNKMAATLAAVLSTRFADYS